MGKQKQYAGTFCFLKISNGLRSVWKLLEGKKEVRDRKDKIPRCSLEDADTLLFSQPFQRSLREPHPSFKYLSDVHFMQKMVGKHAVLRT